MKTLLHCGKDAIQYLKGRLIEGGAENECGEKTVHLLLRVRNTGKYTGNKEVILQWPVWADMQRKTDENTGAKQVDHRNLPGQHEGTGGGGACAAEPALTRKSPIKCKVPGRVQGQKLG